MCGARELIDIDKLTTTIQCKQSLFPRLPSHSGSLTLPPPENPGLPPSPVTDGTLLINRSFYEKGPATEARGPAFFAHIEFSECFICLRPTRAVKK